MMAVDLNQFGRAMLPYMDYRIGGLTSLAVCIILTGVRRVFRKSKPTVLEFFNGALGVVSIYSGAVIATIFLLTKPPAVEFLSNGDLLLISIVTLVGCTYLGITQLKASFFPPNAPKEEPKSEL
jgi:uncharacterized membrane protein